MEEAVAVVREAVGLLTEDPPTWQRARAIATYANVLLAVGEDDSAGEWAERGRAAARAAAAPWLEADSLVSLGLLSQREGRNEEAIEKFTAAHTPGAGGPGPRRRAAVDVPSGPGPPGTRRACHSGQGRPRRRGPGGRDRPEPGALRARRAAPALPGPLRTR